MGKNIKQPNGKDQNKVQPGKRPEKIKTKKGATSDVAPRQKKTKPTESTLERTIKAIQLIQNEGLSLTKACGSLRLSRAEFFKNIDKDTALQNDYVRARERRAELIIEEVIDIADGEEQDKVPFYGPVKVKRDNLRIETRLKYLSTMYPKKYGTQRVELAGDKDNPIHTTVLNLGSGIKPPEENG